MQGSNRAHPIKLLGTDEQALHEATAVDSQLDEQYRHGFIDRFRVVVRCPHGRPLGVYRNIGLNNVTGKLARQSMSYIKVPGPHGYAEVRTYDPAYLQQLDIVLCPGKYFYGHNAYCPGTLHDLVLRGVLDVVKRLGLELPTDELDKLVAGDVDLYEVHCTAMLDLGSDDAVVDKLETLSGGKHSRLRERHRYPKIGTPQTVTFGSGRSHQVTFYNKARRMGFPDHCEDHIREAASKWAEGRLRVEVSLKRRKLQGLGLDRASSWTEITPGKIVREQLGRIRVNETPGLSPSAEAALSPGEYKAYRLWKSGADLKQAYRSSRTRKDYRKRLLEHGIDISVPFCANSPQIKDGQTVIKFAEVINMPFSKFPSDSEKNQQ